jgi:hypothetical protein
MVLPEFGRMVRTCSISTTPAISARSYWRISTTICSGRPPPGHELRYHRASNDRLGVGRFREGRCLAEGQARHQEETGLYGLDGRPDGMVRAGPVDIQRQQALHPREFAQSSTFRAASRVRRQSESLAKLEALPILADRRPPVPKSTLPMCRHFDLAAFLQ